jgi:hypothetical protein
MEKKYRFITIKPAGDTPLLPGYKPVYRVENNKSRGTLGFIEWYAAWRLWEFCPNGGGTAFSSDCLADIQDFMGALKKGEVNNAGGK